MSRIRTAGRPQLSGDTLSVTLWRKETYTQLLLILYFSQNVARSKIAIRGWSRGCKKKTRVQAFWTNKHATRDINRFKLLKSISNNDRFEHKTTDYKPELPRSSHHDCEFSISLSRNAKLHQLLKEFHKNAIFKFLLVKHKHKPLISSQNAINDWYGLKSQKIF